MLQDEKIHSLDSPKRESTTSGGDKSRIEELPILVEELSNGNMESGNSSPANENDDSSSTPVEGKEDMITMQENIETLENENEHHVKAGERKRQYPYSEALLERNEDDNSKVVVDGIKTKVMAKCSSKKRDEDMSTYNLGRWSAKEKKLFLEGLHTFGKGRWKKIGQLVTTRSLVQIKSHGQKMVKKLEAGEDIFAPLKVNSNNEQKQHDQNSNNNSGKLVNFIHGTKEKDTIIAVEALSLLSQGSSSMKKQKIS